ncbi:hypothetical protein A2U01_0091099, partial [Trifolium medium]|nr:hypothetical protein [Trifolium medium]
MARNGAGTEVTIRWNKPETRTLEGKNSAGTELALVEKRTRVMNISQ